MPFRASHVTGTDVVPSHTQPRDSKETNFPCSESEGIVLVRSVIIPFLTICYIPFVLHCYCALCF
jgi:hypothetical protein